MIRNTIHFLILIFTINSYSQDSFEGVVTFKIEIITSKKASEDLLPKLNYRYGDSLQIFYNKEGNFRRKYLNSGEFGGIDTQTYNAEEGKLLIKNKDKKGAQFNDVTVNSLKLISLNKIENEYIINLDCDCYEYIGESENKKKVKLQFCYSNLTNKVDVKKFGKYKDFFISDYFKLAERPYLKFEMQTEEFTLRFTAVKISNIELKKVKI